MTNVDKTKAPLQTARKLAGEEFGDEENPLLVAAILQSFAVDSLSETIQTEAREMTKLLCEAAAVAAGE